MRDALSVFAGEGAAFFFISTFGIFLADLKNHSQDTGKKFWAFNDNYLHHLYLLDSQSNGFCCILCQKVQICDFYSP